MITEKKGCLAFAVCGSFCTLEDALGAAQALTAQGWTLLPIMSFAAQQDTRFGTGESWRQRLQAVTGQPVLDTLQTVEPLGPRRLAQALVVAPCTGATLARLAAGLSDTPVTLAAKACCGWAARWCWRSPPTTALALPAKIWRGCASASTITLCPTGRMTPLPSPRA